MLPKYFWGWTSQVGGEIRTIEEKLPPQGTNVRWDEGAKSRGRPHILGTRDAIVARRSLNRCAGPTDLTGPGRDFVAVRTWSNTGRGADYHPLLGSKRSRAEEQHPRTSREAVESSPRPFAAARSYWLTSPLFARRDPLSGPRKDIPESTGDARPSSSPSSQKAVIFDEGDFLRIGYEGVWIVLRSLKGFLYLQYLLLHPDEKVHVSHLAALGDQRSGLREAGGGIDGRDDPRGRSRSDPPSGDILDPRAKREYRARLVELRAELDEAVLWADLERADSIRREIDFLATQLTQAFNRRGRVRKMSDPTERVRKAVAKRIHDAIDRIAKQHPDLGRHLQNAIRTGYSCWYSPELPVTWTCEPPPPFETPT
jgi:hypothetical protein